MTDFDALLRALGHPCPELPPNDTKALIENGRAESTARLFCQWVAATPARKFLEIALRQGRPSVAASLRRAALDCRTLGVWHGRIAGDFVAAAKQCDELAVMIDGASDPGAAS